MNYGVVVFLVVPLLGLAALAYLNQRRRTAAIRAMATQYGFQYLGDALPSSLTMNGTRFERATSVWNVINGEPRGKRIVVFDCRVGSGKGSTQWTVFAVEGDAGSPGLAIFDQGWSIERSGTWTIANRSRKFFGMSVGGLMSVTDLQTCLAAMTS